MRFSLLSFFLLLLIFISACAQAPRHESSESPPAQTNGQASSADQVGPLPPPDLKDPKDEFVGPAPDPNYVPPKEGYVLVFGPGLARGFAFVGVLQALEQKQVDIRGVVGVEIGATVGAIWASSTLNALEWEMHKFKRTMLLDYSLLAIGKKVAEGKKFYAFLDRAVKVPFLQKMRVPVFVASMSGQEILFEGAGSSKDILRGAIGIPGIIQSYTFEGKERMSAALESPYPVTQARNLGLGKIMCVDVLGRGNNFTPREPLEEHLSALMKSTSVVAREQLKSCDVVLSIPTDGISYLGFEAKADLIYRGRVAVEQWLAQKP